MADEKECCQNLCANDPNFAIICSFFDRFSAACGITHPTFAELQEMIESSQDVPSELIELHVKLLRKIRKSVSAEKWERALIKFCHSYYCSEDGWELERCGYNKCKVSSKLRILKTLLDAQFDLNAKFKADINKLTAEELRMEPLGRDKVGQSYWCQFDPAANIRVYKEDQDEETWKLVAKDREGLVGLITQLSSGEELLGLELLNEDSNSQELEKPIIDTGQIQVSTSEENSTDNTCSIEIKTDPDIKKEDSSFAPCNVKDTNNIEVKHMELSLSSTPLKDDVESVEKENIKSGDLSADFKLDAEKVSKIAPSEICKEEYQSLPSCQNKIIANDNLRRQETDTYSELSSKLEESKQASEDKQLTVKDVEPNQNNISPEVKDEKQILSASYKEDPLDVSNEDAKKYPSNEGAPLGFSNEVSRDSHSNSEAPLDFSNEGSKESACHNEAPLDFSYGDSSKVSECNKEAPLGFSNENSKDAQSTSEAPLDFSNEGSKGSTCNRETPLGFNNGVCKSSAGTKEAPLGSGGNGSLKVSSADMEPLLNVKIESSTSSSCNEAAPLDFSNEGAKERFDCSHTKNQQHLSLNNSSLESSKSKQDCVSSSLDTLKEPLLFQKKSLSDSASLGHTSETGSLDVTEEIKQRSLFKSTNIGQSLFKNKNNKSFSGSKLEQIFGHKLEGKSAAFGSNKNSNSFSLSANTACSNDVKPVIQNLSLDQLSDTGSVLQGSNTKNEPIEKELNLKRKTDETDEQPNKKICSDSDQNEVGEEIEEPVMIIKGEGSGHDCDTGNPATETNETVTTEKKSDECKEQPNLKVKNAQDSMSQCSDSQDTFIGKKQNSNCDVESVNSSTENDHEKSIEEQLSALTGESFSPNEILDSEKPDDTVEKVGKSKPLSNTYINDGDVVPPETKKTKIVKDTVEIFGSDETSALQENLSTKGAVNVVDPQFVESKKQIDLKQNSIENDLGKGTSVEVPEVLKEKESCSSNEEDNKCNPVSDNNKSIKTESKQEENMGNSLPVVNNEKDNNISDCKSSENVTENHFESNKCPPLKQNVKANSSSNSKKLKKSEGIKNKKCDETKNAKSNSFTGKLELNSNEVNKDSQKALDKPKDKNPTSCDSKARSQKTQNEGENLSSCVNDGTDSNNVNDSNGTETKQKDASDKSEEEESDTGDSPKKKGSIKRKTAKKKRLFSPKKKINKNRETKSSKKDSNGENECTPARDKLKQEETIEKSGTGEAGTEVNQKLHVESKPSQVASRKRRGSQIKGTGTEKDSADETVSDKKNGGEAESEEIGGKRRKIKAKRPPNKTLRKSIENQRNSKSSSEEDNLSDKNNEKCSKKSSPPSKKTQAKGSKAPKKPVSKTKDNKPKPKKNKEDTEVSDSAKEASESGKKKKTSNKPKGTNSRAYSGINLNIDLNDSSRSVRQSSRLAQLKIKEQYDTKHDEHQQEKPEKTGKKSKKKRDESEEKPKGKLKKKKIKPAKKVSEDENSDEPEKKKGRRKKKNKKPVFNERDPWKSSSGTSTEMEEEEDHFDDVVEEDEFVPVLDKSDHEFSPESDIDDEDYKPIRRARTAQKVTEPTEEAAKSKEIDDFACEKCGKKDHPEWILLCDTCDHGWHASCLRPSLMLVPEGDWHCPPCQHTKLVKELQEALTIYDRDQKRRENEELRRKRLAYVGISLDNVLPHGQQQQPKEKKERESESSGSSRSSSDSESEYSDEPIYQLRQRRQGPTSYRFNEFDDLINSAIQEEVEGVGGAVLVSKPTETSGEGPVTGEGPGKPAEINGETPSTKEQTPVKPKKKEKVGSGDESSEEDEDEEDEEEEEFPSVVPKRNNVLPRPGRKKHRRLNCLDDPSDDDDGSDEDFKGSSSEDEEEEDDDDGSDDSEIGRRGRSKRGHLVPVRRSSRARRSRIDKEFINDDSDESDAPRRKKKKKLWTESDSESDDSTWGKRKKKKNYSFFGKRKSKKNRKFVIEDELSETETTKVQKQKRQRKIKYGGLDDLNVEDLPSRRTRGRQINYQEVLGSDSDEEIKGKKISRRAVVEDEDEFVAEKEESDASSDEDEEDVEDEEKSSDESGGQEIKEKVKDEKKEQKTKQEASTTETSKTEILKTETVPVEIVTTNPSPPQKQPPKVSPVKSVKKDQPARRGRPPKAMIAPPPERLISEDEKYKAIVSKVSTIDHSDQNLDSKSDINCVKPLGVTEYPKSLDNNSFVDNPHQVTPVKVLNTSFDPKLIHRSPPIKIRSGVAVNAAGRRSPGLLSPINEGQFFPKSPTSGMIGSPPDRSQFSPVMQRSTTQGLQSGVEHMKTSNTPLSNVKSEIVDDVEDEDLIDNLEDEEGDIDDSDDDILEEGEIPKKVAKRMAREEERLQRLEEIRIAREMREGKASGTGNGQSISPGSTQPPATNHGDQKPTQPLLRVVSPLKLMANPPGPLQSSFMPPGMNARMAMPNPPVPRIGMPMRPPQPGGMMPGVGMDDVSPTKRRGRGRGKKVVGQEKPEPELMGGGSVIRGMLQQQPQSYPPTHYPQQYPPHPRIPFSPQRMPRPPFHPGQHHPLDPSPSGGGPVNIKQEPAHPSSNPVNIPTNKPPISSAPPYHPPPHRFESGIPRQPNYPPPKPQYGSYPPPPAPSGNYHYGSYPPPLTPREEPQPYQPPPQQQFSEQFQEQPPPPPPPTTTTTSEEDTGEFGGLVSYFSSQREDNIDT